MIQQMGSLKDLMEKIPGLSGMIPPGVNVDDQELSRIEAIIQSMTRVERSDPNSLVREPSRVRRIASGSGSPEVAVNELVQKFLFMQQMMGGLGAGGGLLGQIPGMKGIAAARQMRRAAKNAAGMGPAGMGFPGLGMPPMGMPGMMPGDGAGLGESPKMRQLTAAERNAKKNQRKRKREARKKNKGRR